MRLTASEELAARVPPLVSRETYRIVQETLSNALRHAASAPVALCLSLDDEELIITVTNPLTGASPRRRGGGRGLGGMRERATLLGGSLEAGAERDGWQVTARLPLRGRR
ncbi:ATP-binding protein [Streptomyces sp. WMMC897]|uniref:ATP-binding protein n=1 Tax=Streptomyces sp. WMMC897 TaxID=3014782 RepID=UPI002FC35B89